MVYFDTSYLVRLYIEDVGFDIVRSLAEPAPIASSFHGEIGTIAALHRVYRDNRISRGDYLKILDQFHDDSKAGLTIGLRPGKNSPRDSTGFIGMRRRGFSFVPVMPSILLARERTASPRFIPTIPTCSLPRRLLV